MKKRVFRTRVFARWSRKILPDNLLWQAAHEIENGGFDGDLGGGVCKKRIALPGRGKSGSTRTLVAVRDERALFFLVGRRKSDPGGDFSDKEVEAAKILAGALATVSAELLERMKVDGKLMEILDDQDPKESHAE